MKGLPVYTADTAEDFIRADEIKHLCAITIVVTFCYAGFVLAVRILFECLDRLGKGSLVSH